MHELRWPQGAIDYLGYILSNGLRKVYTPNKHDIASSGDAPILGVSPENFVYRFANATTIFCEKIY